MAEAQRGPAEARRVWTKLGEDRTKLGGHTPSLGKSRPMLVTCSPTLVRVSPSFADDVPSHGHVIHYHRATMPERRSIALAFLLAVPSVACSAGAAGRHVPAGAAVTLAHSDPYAYADARVGTYVSSNWGFSTNSYWIEGPEGLVVVDTQFLPSAAAEMVAWAEQSTGKKVVLAVVLHANPDKFNGTEVLQRRGIRVVTSDEVRALIPAVFEKRTRAFASRYAPDWPTSTPAPDSFGASTTDLHAGGLTLRAHVLGHVDEWLDRIAEIRALHPTYVHPGRGPSAGPGLLDAQERYLKRVRELVLAEHPSMPVDPNAIDRIRATLVREYPDYDYDVFLGMGLPAVWARYARPPR